MGRLNVNFICLWQNGATMKKLMLLINPNAGRGSYRFGLGEVLHTFHQAGYRSTLYFTDARGDAARLAARDAENYDLVVCIGGDGTLSETVNGLMQCSRRPPVGYIPMGTTNDVARTLAISSTPAYAARTAVHGRRRPLDIGRYNNGDYFTYVAAFGAFTEVSYETPQSQKQALGRLAYILSGMAALGRLSHRRARVEWDGGIVEDDFIFGCVTNSRSIAGLVKLKDVTDEALADGQFEIILVRKPADALQLGAIVTDVLASNFSGENVILLRSKKVRFLFNEPTAWTRDGEAGGEHTDIFFENIPSAIQIAAD